MKKTLIVLALCPWVLFNMYQDGTRAEGYWWKKEQTFQSGALCRQAVQKMTSRTMVGLISWYVVPKDQDGPTKDIPKWIGCLPADYDPYERR